jgi:hypothetical protein
MSATVAGLLQVALLLAVLIAAYRPLGDACHLQPEQPLIRLLGRSGVSTARCPIGTRIAFHGRTRRGRAGRR